MSFLLGRPAGRCHISFWEYMTFTKFGCFLKWWYPHFTPQVLIIFSRKTHGFVGETHHFRKPPNRHSCESSLVVNIFEPFGMSLLSNMPHLFWSVLCHRKSKQTTTPSRKECMVLYGNFWVYLPRFPPLNYPNVSKKKHTIWTPKSFQVFFSPQNMG